MNRDFIKRTMMSYYRTMARGARIQWTEAKEAEISQLVDKMIEQKTAAAVDRQEEG